MEGDTAETTMIGDRTDLKTGATGVGGGMADTEEGTATTTTAEMTGTTGTTEGTATTTTTTTGTATEAGTAGIVAVEGAVEDGASAETAPREPRGLGTWLRSAPWTP